MRPVFKRCTDADFHKRITRKLIQLAPWRGDDPPQVDPDGKYPFIEYSQLQRHFGRFKVGEEPDIFDRFGWPLSFSKRREVFSAASFV
jgi:hypothetical protein